MSQKFPFLTRTKINRQHINPLSKVPGSEHLPRGNLHPKYKSSEDVPLPTINHSDFFCSVETPRVLCEPGGALSEGSQVFLLLSLIFKMFRNCTVQKPLVSSKMNTCSSLMNMSFKMSVEP